MKLVELLKEKATANQRRIVLPESSAPEIVEAAYQACTLGLCKPILVGSEDIVKANCVARGIPEEGWYTLEDPENADLDQAAKDLCEVAKLDEMTARFMLEDPLYYAAMLVCTGRADGMVAGYIAETAEVISVGMMTVGLKESAGFPSSYFIMDIPGFQNGEDGMLVYADAGVTIDPSAEELAQIAVQTAESVSNLLGWEPRVAMLSCSTKGSASHDRIDKVIEACEIAHKLNPDLLLDGEMQADAAIVPAVAKKKIPGTSPVGGRANILVFPDLDAGNIAYKLTQRLTGGQAYGPLLQGFRKPVCDLSRGSSVEDIVGIIAVAAAQ